jgi:hypothetical protein
MGSQPLLQALFGIALLLYVPALIAFYSAASECVFAAGHQPISEPDPLAPAQPPRSVQFMTLTNMAFLVRVVVKYVRETRNQGLMYSNGLHGKDQHGFLGKRSIHVT